MSVSKDWLKVFFLCVAVVTVHRATQLSAQSVVIVWLIFQMYLQFITGTKESFGLWGPGHLICSPDREFLSVLIPTGGAAQW